MAADESLHDPPPWSLEAVVLVHKCPAETVGTLRYCDGNARLRL